ncbi:MAG: aspartate ammonia-lyase, partial [Deltaproteobacteria bacterium]|nr:aspartate ammonia-lyase [Deltaproteobacteria bacterium]
AQEFVDIKKIGRTHLQDAVPMTLGQEFSGYARQIELGMKRITATEERLSELAIGGTAVNHFEAQAARDAAVETSGALKTIAVSLVKIANDIRWLASGPRCGIGEIHIPSLQPGSSMMPGKVNPVIPEVVIQVAAQIMGNDTTIMIGGQSGNFELNVMLPVIAYNLLQSIHLLSTASETFARKCLSGTLANREQCAAYIEKSLALSTGLVPHIGYDRAAAIAKKANETGKTIREIAIEEGILPENMLNQIFKDHPSNVL